VLGFPIDSFQFFCFHAVCFVVVCALFLLSFYAGSGEPRKSKKSFGMLVEFVDLHALCLSGVMAAEKAPCHTMPDHARKTSFMLARRPSKYLQPEETKTVTIDRARVT